MASTVYFDKAFNLLTSRSFFRHGEEEIKIACLIRMVDWRPLAADWWRGKEAHIIGADIDGNFFLRHCDGTVRLWRHLFGLDIVVASSLDEFAKCISTN
jgi:hypothetical protein